MNLGNLPFLEELDIRNTEVTTVNARYCPRLTTVKGAGSKLQRVDLAPASKITTLQIPATYKTLVLRHLPSLTIDGIVFQNGAGTYSIPISVKVQPQRSRNIAETIPHIDRSHGFAGQFARRSRNPGH